MLMLICDMALDKNCFHLKIISSDTFNDPEDAAQEF